MYKNKMHLSFAMEKSETRTIHVSNPEHLLVQLLMTFFFFRIEIANILKELDPWKPT